MPRQADARLGGDLVQTAAKPSVANALVAAAAMICSRRSARGSLAAHPRRQSDPRPALTHAGAISA